MPSRASDEAVSDVIVTAQRALARCADIEEKVSDLDHRIDQLGSELDALEGDFNE